MQLYTEKERDGGAYSDLYPPACADRYSLTFIRLPLQSRHLKRLSECLGEGDGGRVMVVTKGTRKQGRGVGRMSSRTAFWLAWSLWALCVVLIGLTLLLNFLTEPLDRGQVFSILALVLSLAYPTVGALIASRLPANPIGWIFCGTGLLYAGGSFTEPYANYAQLENPAFPGGGYMAWFSWWLGGFEVLVMAAVFVMLLFPDGHLL